MDVKKAAAAERDYIVSVRREFHRHPELSLQEFRTAQRIEEELDRFGIPHTRVGETGVLGTLKGEKENGKVLVLRADIDALPIEETHECAYRSENAGAMHACGHDAHAACLLGAAKILAANRDVFGGEIRLVFQPDEEIGQGAKPFVKAGAKVQRGDVLCIIEAMKLMNEITAEQDGVISQVCVSNGQVVEYGTVLFKMEA